MSVPGPTPAPSGDRAEPVSPAPSVDAASGVSSGDRAEPVSPAALTALCRDALPAEGLDERDITTCCFEGGAEVIGDDGAAVAYVVKEVAPAVTVAWLLLVAVAPGARRAGRGRALVEQVAARCRAAGATELHTGNCAPRYVWPGVDLANTAALAFFQSLGFEPYDHGLNMVLPTTFRAPPPAGVRVEREDGDGAAAFARRAFPHWEDEVTRGAARGTTFAARTDDGTTVGFACHSVNRHGWIGPMATDPARRGAGTGNALLGAVAADLAATGSTRADVAWVAPIPFYAKAGAVAGRAFRIHKMRI